MCDRLRSILVGLPPCCRLCHARGTTKRIVVNGEPMVACCHLLTAILGRYMGQVVFDPYEDPWEEGGQLVVNIEPPRAACDLTDS